MDLREIIKGQFHPCQHKSSSVVFETSCYVTGTKGNTTKISNVILKVVCKQYVFVCRAKQLNCYKYDHWPILICRPMLLIFTYLVWSANLHIPRALAYSFVSYDAYPFVSGALRTPILLCPKP